MKAILMAAGRGTRLSRAVQYVPKSTFSIDGVPLIRRTIQVLQKRGIAPVVCVGYKKEVVFDALQGLDVVYYENPFFDVTNSIASLWFAQQEIIGKTLLMNADVYFEEDILDILLQDSSEAVLLVDKERIRSGDYFFQLESGCIRKYGKDLPLEDRSCEHVGIAKIEESFVPTLLDTLNDLVGAQQHGKWWEDVLYTLSHSRDIHTLDVQGHFWAEIDYLDDYERIMAYVKTKKSSRKNEEAQCGERRKTI